MNIRTKRRRDYMSKSIMSKALMSISILLSASLVAQEVTITWDASLQPGQIESFIQGDTTSAGEQANSVYILEKGKIYLQKTEINLRKRHTKITIKGQEVTGDEVPATIQPHPLEDGTSGFTGWPNGNFQMQIKKIARFFNAPDIISLPDQHLPKPSRWSSCTAFENF